MRNQGFQGGVRNRPGRQRRKWLVARWLVLFLLLPGALGEASGAEVQNFGISRQGERTMVTILLDEPASPRVSPSVSSGRSQLVVEFPGARAGRLPQKLTGDEELVREIRSEVSAAGVRIVLEMNPQQPYLWKRELQNLSGGRAMVRLTLRPDAGAAASRPAAPEASPEPPPVTAAKEPEKLVLPRILPRRLFEKKEATPRVSPPAASPAAPSAATPAPVPLPPEPATPPSGAFVDLYKLMPRAKGLLDYLRGEGWSVTEDKTYDRPGVRFSRAFGLTNPRYPEMSIRIAHVPPTAPDSPAISIIDLALDRLRGKAADDYRALRQWTFAQIKSKYEDIGDFFDEALKPLRVELRQECQRLALRHAEVIKGFLGQAARQKPALGEQALTLIAKKVSPRFEGVQYTLSEDPLVILNLVDFLYIRVYQLEGPS